MNEIKSCLCDQELGWANKRPRRFGASAEERPEHFTRSNVAFPEFLGTSCPPVCTCFKTLTVGVTVPRWHPTCRTSRRHFSIQQRCPISRASLVWGAIGRPRPPAQVYVEDRVMTFHVRGRSGKNHRCPGDRASGHTEHRPCCRQAYARQPFCPRDSRQHSLEVQQRSHEVLLRVPRGPGAQLVRVSFACVGALPKRRTWDLSSMSVSP